MTTSIKAWIVAGVLALFVGLWLVKGVLEASAHRNEAVAHKIEIRRSSPARIGFLRRLQQGKATAAEDPGGVQTEVVDAQSGQPVEVAEGIEIVIQ